MFALIEKEAFMQTPATERERSRGRQLFGKQRTEKKKRTEEAMLYDEMYKLMNGFTIRFAVVITVVVVLVT